MHPHSFDLFLSVILSSFLVALSYARYSRHDGSLHENHGHAAAGAIIPQLHTLWLGPIRCSVWHSVDVLSMLGVLREVHPSGNSIVGGPESKARLEVR